MKPRGSSDPGFTTAELLVTLFVAAAFMIAAFQLYSLVIQDSSDAAEERRANNAALFYMRKHSEKATNPCQPQDVMPLQSVAVDDLSDVYASVSITCPYDASGTSSVSMVSVRLTYGSSGGLARHSTLIDRSREGL